MNDSAKDNFLEYISYIKASYKPWYNRSVYTLMISWYICQLFTILCGFASSIIAAFIDQSIFINNGKILLIIVSALGSLAATIILQFRLYDLWKLRESGRITIETLISDGLLKVSSNLNDDDYKILHLEFINKIEELERSQSTGFFTK